MTRFLIFALLMILNFSTATRAVASDTLAFEQAMFANNETGLRSGKRTDGVVIIQRGKTLFEKYDRGFNENSQHIMWSASKTVMALLFGVAVQEKKVAIDQSICDFLKNEAPNKCDMKIRDVLQWSSGLSWKEEYEKGDILHSSVLTMLYGEHHDDMAAYVLSQSMQTSPGKMWRYSSGDSILLAKILARVFAPDDLREVFGEKLFAPLDIKNWTWEVDPAGTLSGAFYLYLSARELAKIGQLFLHRGLIGDRQIVAPEFIDFMTTVPASFTAERPDDQKIRHISGAHVWLNKSADTGVLPLPKSWSFAPTDTITANGHWGQYLVVVPSLDLIAVRVGDTRDTSFNLEIFVSELMKLTNYSAGDTAPVKTDASEKNEKAQNQSAIDWILNLPTFVRKKSREAQLAVGYVAKNFCSCMFVEKNSEEKCRDYASIPQAAPNFSADLDAKTATASFLIWSAHAHYEGQPNTGCVLDR